MHFQRALATSVSAFIGMGAAVAADWQIIRKPEEGSASGYLELDRASIVRKGHIVSVWTRAIYEKDFEVPGSTSLRSRVIASLTDFNCKDRTETIRKIIFLSDDEAQLKLGEQGPFEATDIVPGTPKEKTFEIACRRRK